MKKLIILLLLVPTLAMSGTFKSDGGISLKISSKDGFKLYTNYMGHKDHNFKYIKDKNKARAGKYFQRLEVRDGDCFGDDGWNDCDNDRERVDININPKLKPVD